MASITISIPDLLRDWIEQRLESGRYPNVDTYLRALLERDQEDAAGAEALVAALGEGERSGISPRRVTDILDDVMTGRRGDAA